MKPTLAGIQNDFQEYVLGRTSDNPAIKSAILNQYGLNADDRLAIYYDAYRIRMREALSDTYGKTHGYIGDDMFAEFSTGYLQAYPSHSPNLRWYGQRFSVYLQQVLPDHPVVAELAAFEWALSLAFDAPDAPTLTIEDMQVLQPEQWETLGFHLHPSLQFLPMHTNATAIWLAMEQDLTPPDAVVSENPEHWLIWRKQLQSHFRSLDQYETKALQELRRGDAFSAVCDAANESAGEQDITPKIAGWLQTWLHDELLGKIRERIL
jgi:hypothetical protein